MIEAASPRVLNFVRKVVPFDTWTPGKLAEAVETMEITYFPQEQVIIEMGGDPA
ncbi:hypothetical protein DFAR_2550005 [Desulfarculales bacterium]